MSPLLPDKDKEKWIGTMFQFTKVMEVYMGGGAVPFGDRIECNQMFGNLSCGFFFFFKLALRIAQEPRCVEICDLSGCSILVENVGASLVIFAMKTSCNLSFGLSYLQQAILHNLQILFSAIFA